MPNALENYTDIEWFAHNYLDHVLRPYSDVKLDERVKAFMEEDPGRQAIVTRKQAKHDAKLAELRRQLPDHREGSDGDTSR